MLGVQWLPSVSPVLWDFQQLTLEFDQANIHYKLVHQSLHVPTIQEVSLQHIDRELSNFNLTLILYSIKSQKLEASNLNPMQLQELQALLQRFELVFTLPITLPPYRIHDHQIPLVPGAKPPNIKPYH